MIELRIIDALTGAELLRVLRVREAYRAGFYDDFDDHEGWREGSRHRCRLVAVARAGLPNTPIPSPTRLRC